MLAKVNGLIKERRQRVRDVEPPQNGEAHPATAGLAGNRTHDGDARNIEQNKDEVAVGRRGAAKFLAHHAHGTRCHFAVTFTGLNRVRQHTQAKGVFQALPCLFDGAQQFVTEMKLCRIERLLWMFSAV